MTTKIYFKPTWVFKDGRNSVSSDFCCVDIYQDVFESIPNTDSQEKQHISKQFSLFFLRAFPQFNNNEYKMTAIGMYSIVIMLDPTDYCAGLGQLIQRYKNTCIKADGAIPLQIVQRRPKQQPLVTNALVTVNKVCRECHGNITGISFQCSKCKDYKMCCLCVTSGKLLEHGVVRATDSKVDRDTVAKLRSAFIEIKKKDPTSKKVKKLLARHREQKAKIKELDAENKRLVATRSEATATSLARWHVSLVS